MKPVYLAMAAALLALPALSPAARAESPIGIGITAEQARRLGIETAALRSVDQVANAELPARVIPSRKGSVTAVAPFGGAVTRVDVLPGQTVKAGDALATVASRDFAENLSGLEQARAEAGVADAALERARELKKEGLVSGSTLQNAEAEARRAHAMLAEHQRFAGAARDAGSTAGGYIVRAQVSGRVSLVTVKSGDMLEALAPVASIATSDALWVEIQAPARLAGRIAQGDVVEFGPGLSGAVLSVGDAIDPVTRSLVVTAAAPEDAGLRLGDTIRVRLLAGAEGEGQFEAPSSGVIRMDGQDVVFVAVEGGFRVVPVRVAGRTSDRVIVTGDLKTGMQIAVRGLTELKAVALSEGE
ncbi:MAG: efflux RND transporter periplasmic adaptor subunit [Hyphomonadaceae bacterium]